MDAVAEVKARLSVEDVISEYVQLKRAGQNYKGLSPFTNERTPSFVVSPDKQIWHDFSSGRGGDMFTFVQEVEGLDFIGALELLARKAGIDLEQYQSKGGKKGPAKERLYALLDAAAKFYQVQFAANPAAYNYLLKKRKFSKHTALEFRLGYSPDTERAATDYLFKKGFTEEELKAAGISVLRRGRLGDMFRGRIMIPLADPFGQIIGFTARLLEDRTDAPKYINTSSTVLYDKSRHIYGLHLAKQSIRTDKIAVLVEGNLDVIASHQAGVKNVVATAGTALTEQQLKNLGRLTPDIRLAFDQDRAGIAAAERAIPIASKVGVELSIITIPDGNDPDELIQKDPKIWKNAIAVHQPALDWLIEKYQAQLDLSTAVGKRKFSDTIINIVRRLSDTVEQDHYIQKIAGIIDIDIGSMRAKLQGSDSDVPRLKKMNASPTPIATNKEAKRLQQRLLGLSLMLPGTRGYLDLLEESMFDEPEAKRVFSFLKANLEFDGEVEKAAELNQDRDYVKMLSLQFDELYGEIDTMELQYEAARLRATIIDYFVKQQKKEISARFTDASDASTEELLIKARALDQLLNRVKQ